MIRITHNPEFMDGALRELSRLVSPELQRAAVHRALLVLQAAIVRQTKARLDKDPTGALMRSWEVDLFPAGGGGIRSTLPYARIHNEGGVIQARSGRHLAIPLRPPITAGMRGLRPRDDPTPMRAWRSKAGSLFLWDVSQTPPVPRYLLRRSVQIPATHYLDVAVRTSEEDAARAITATIEEAIRGAT